MLQKHAAMVGQLSAAAAGAAAAGAAVTAAPSQQVRSPCTDLASCTTIYCRLLISNPDLNGLLISHRTACHRCRARLPPMLRRLQHLPPMHCSQQRQRLPTR